MIVVRYLVLLLLTTSCATTVFNSPDIVDKSEGKYTLRMYTGTHGESLYKDNFSDVAEDICKGADSYDILEQSFNPSTLSTHKKGHYYWVIKCK